MAKKYFLWSIIAFILPPVFLMGVVYLVAFLFSGLALLGLSGWWPWYVCLGIAALLYITAYYFGLKMLRNRESLSPVVKFLGIAYMTFFSFSIVLVITMFILTSLGIVN